MGRVEKHEYNDGMSASPRQCSRRRDFKSSTKHWAAVLVSLVLLFCIWNRYGDGLFSQFSRANRQTYMPKDVPLTKDKMIKDFKDITPSEKLEWYPCYRGEDFKCARLTVPMDYNRPLNASRDNPKVHIALTLKQGTGKPSVSPLLVNPGGPGGSGVLFVYLAGGALQKVVGDDQDVIGFDPRGIGYTTPVADCWTKRARDSKDSEPSVFDFAQASFHRLTWQLAGWGIGLPGLNDDALKIRDSRARSVAKLCKSTDDILGDDSILKHVGTTAVSRDMLSIIDAWDAWLAELNEGRNAPESLNSISEGEEETALDTKGKLVYWGFSYGTLLGATFASMFPNRVGRVILDGVVDADYYVGPIWADSLRDTDAVEQAFIDQCHEAGKRCAFYRDGDSSHDIRQRFEHVLESLSSYPFIGIDERSNTPTVLTLEPVKMIIFGVLYSPTAGFPFLATILSALDRGDLEAVQNWFPQPNSYIDYTPFCETELPEWLKPGVIVNDAQMAIMCSDKRYPLNETVPNLQNMFEKISNVSRYADIWTGLMLGCDGYAVKSVDPPMRWDEHPAHKQKPIKTEFPVLFLSNTADPVTPLYAGVKMAKKFVGAGLIEQQSEGHCTLAAASLCTLSRIRLYLREGKVPPPPKWGEKGHEIENGEWVRCARDDWPWEKYDSKKYLEINSARVDTEQLKKEAEMLQAWKDIQAPAVRFFAPWMGLSGLVMEQIPTAPS